MNKLQTNFAIVDLTESIPSSELQHVVASLNVQQQRDFRPRWGRYSNIVIAKSKKMIPHGMCGSFLVKEMDEPGALGYHTDENNQPVIYSLYDSSTDWTITPSHEHVEVPPDPFGNRLVPLNIPGVGLVQALLEVGDPCEARSYKIDGVSVSDFLTPQFYGYDQEDKGDEPLTFLGSIKNHGEILPGGYISYVKPDGVWEQMVWFDGPGPVTNVLGMANERPKHESLREWVDRMTNERRSK